MALCCLLQLKFFITLRQNVSILHIHGQTTHGVKLLESTAETHRPAIKLLKHI